MGLSLKMQIAYIGVYIVGAEAVMSCWDWLGSAGIHPSTQGLPRSRPRGVDRAPGPLDLLPGPCRPWRASARTCATPEGLDSIWGVWRCLEAVWRPWSTSEGLQTRFGVSRGVWRPCATPEGLQRAPDTSRRPPQVRSGSHKLAPVQVKVDGEAVRFRNLCPNASA